MTIKTQYTALTDSDTECSGGLITYWILPGGLDLPKLTEEWKTVGLPENLLPILPSPADSLRRAVQEHITKGQIARAQGHRDSHWAVFRTEDDNLPSGEATERFHHLYSVRFVEGIESLTFIKVNATDKEMDNFRALVIRSYELNRTSLAPPHISAWLVYLVWYLHGVAVRPSGGVYFLLPAHVPLWKKVADAVANASSCMVYEIPAVRSQEAVAAILAAVTTEAEEAIKELETEIADKGLKSKALEARLGSCRDIESKVNSYKEFLGDQFVLVTSRLETLQAKINGAR